MDYNENIVGRQFGQLTAKKKVGQSKGSKAIWECECTCGRTHKVAIIYLLYGKSKSCGCRKRGRKPKDVTGWKFGKLTAIERVGMDNVTGAIWRCRCDCGREHTTSLDHLTSGNTQSCGCIPVSIKNRRFGSLKALKLMPLFVPGKKGKRKKSTGKRRWKCRCDCGRTIVVPEISLRKGTKKSCGCRSHIDPAKEYNQLLLNQRHNTEKLSDGYIRKLITKRNSLTAVDIPDEMVEVYRLFIQLKREAQNEKDGH